MGWWRYPYHSHNFQERIIAQCSLESAWGIVWSNLLLIQESVLRSDQATQGFNQSHFAHFQGWSLHSLSEQSVTVRLPSGSQFLPTSSLNCSPFILCSWSLTFLPYIAVKSLAPSPWRPPCRHSGLFLGCSKTISAPGWTSPALPDSPHLRRFRSISSSILIIFHEIGSIYWCFS